MDGEKSMCSIWTVLVCTDMISLHHPLKQVMNCHDVRTVVVKHKINIDE
jgi:hypothetical protein